jgi:dihydropteroate synthase
MSKKSMTRKALVTSVLSLILCCAMLVGTSRKRVIGEACGNIGAEARLPGTIAAHTIAISSGANIIRVHDVKEAVLAAKMVDAILKA